MPYCFYCGAAFNRDEHLERHILTHTNAKPYKCFTCYMAFGRRDLLNRHYAVHGKDSNQQPLPPTEGIIPKPARRTPIACKSCAKTKTKCDRKVPCTRCASRNLTCEPRPSRRTSKSSSTCGTTSEVESPTADDEDDLAQLSLEDNTYAEQNLGDMFLYHNHQTLSSDDMLTYDMQPGHENTQRQQHPHIPSDGGIVSPPMFNQFQPQPSQSQHQTQHYEGLSRNMQSFASTTPGQMTPYAWDYTQMQPDYPTLEMDGQQHMARSMMRWDLNGY